MEDSQRIHNWLSTLDKADNADDTDNLTDAIDDLYTSQRESNSGLSV